MGRVAAGEPVSAAAENYRVGTAAAAERYAAAMEEARPKQLAAARRERTPCVVPACVKGASKGRLCRAHWEMVPAGDRMQVMLDAMRAQRRAADRAHRRLERELIARLRSKGSLSQPPAQATARPP